jgi:flagellar hook protein FlgE
MAVNGVIDTNGPLSDLKVPAGSVMGAVASSAATYAGNLDSAAADGTVLNRTIDLFDATGASRTLTLTFTKAAAGWSVAASDGTATVGSTAVTFGADGRITGPTSLSVGGVTVDMSTLTGYAGLDTVKATTQNGQAAGTLQSFSLGADGTITGSFSNGLKQVIGRIALGAFTNPAGLEKAGGSLFRTTVNSGDAAIGTAGTGGRGSLAGGALEMSNVDLSSEFTSLIVAQRGFQANSRVITTSDEVLQELVNLKR